MVKLKQFYGCGDDLEVSGPGPTRRVAGINAISLVQVRTGMGREKSEDVILYNINGSSVTVKMCSEVLFQVLYDMSLH